MNLDIIKILVLLFGIFKCFDCHSLNLNDTTYSYYTIDSTRMRIIKDTALHIVNMVDSSNLKIGIWVKGKNKVFYYKKGDLTKREFFFENGETKRITLYREGRRTADERYFRCSGRIITIRLIKQPKTIKGCQNCS